jgi:hypothetical protein
MAVIIPVAAHANTSRLTSPVALAGVAIALIAFSTSFLPATDTGTSSTIASVTSCRRPSFWSTSPKIETSTIASGTIENSTRYAIPAACCGQPSAKKRRTASGITRASFFPNAIGHLRKREDARPRCSPVQLIGSSRVHDDRLQLRACPHGLPLPGIAGSPEYARARSCSCIRRTRREPKAQNPAMVPLNLGRVDR